MFTYVVTKNVAQFHDYCRIHRLNPAACRLVTSLRELEAIDASAHRIVFWGDFQELEDARRDRAA